MLRGIGAIEKRRLALEEAFSFFVDPETEAMKRSDLPLLLTIAGVERPDEVLAILMGNGPELVTWGWQEAVVTELTTNVQSRHQSRRSSVIVNLEGVKRRRRHSLVPCGVDTGVMDGIVPSMASAVFTSLAGRSWLGIDTGSSRDVMKARDDFMGIYRVWCTEAPGMVKLAELENRIVWGVLPSGNSSNGYEVFSKVSTCTPCTDCAAARVDRCWLHHTPCTDHVSPC